MLDIKYIKVNYSSGLYKCNPCVKLRDKSDFIISLHYLIYQDVLSFDDNHVYWRFGIKQSFLL